MGSKEACNEGRIRERKERTHAETKTCGGCKLWREKWRSTLMERDREIEERVFIYSVTYI